MKPLFDFASDSGLGRWMRDSQYAFPAFETLHLIGLGLLLGALFFLNARFLGFALRRQRVSEVAQDLNPWITLGLVIMAVSGVPLFASKAQDLWNEDLPAYVIKMSLIAFSMALHYGVQMRLARTERLAAGRTVAALALLTWFGAAIAGLTLEFL